MNRTQQIKQWLGNRQRKYADGVAIFMAVARKVQLEKYAKYFAEVSSPEIFDHHFTMLVNLLTRIHNDILRQPALYPKASEEVADVKMLQQEEQAKVLIKDLTGRTLKYEVYSHYIVKSNDTNPTSQITHGKKEVTLITCTNGLKERRIIKALEVVE